MALTRGFIRNAVTTPLDARLADMGTIAGNADGSARSGVLGAANVSIVSALGTMHVAIAAAEFVTSKGKADGVAIFTNDGVVNVAIGAAPASNSRIDAIWVKHNDDTTGDANALPVFGVTAGTAAASPTKPAIPTGALELATLRIYSGTTATNGGANTLTNTYRMTAARGGIVPVRDATELAAYAAADGTMARNLATGILSRRQGGAWMPDVDDTGWVDVPLNPGFAALNVDERPRVRRIGSVVYMRGSMAPTGMVGGGNYNVAVIPAGFRPTTNIIMAVGSSAASGVGAGVISAAGLITIRTASSLGTYYGVGGFSWPID